MRERVKMNKICKCGTHYITADNVCPVCRELINNKQPPHFNHPQTGSETPDTIKDTTFNTIKGAKRLQQVGKFAQNKTKK